jgi:hypothetical protein
VRVFPTTERPQAIEWLVALPAGSQITDRVLPDAGVVIVEAKEPLRVQELVQHQIAPAARTDGLGPLR